MWNQADEEEEDLMFSPALMARRASESWISAPPIEVKQEPISPKHPEKTTVEEKPRLTAIR